MTLTPVQVHQEVVEFCPEKPQGQGLRVLNGNHHHGDIGKVTLERCGPGEILAAGVVELQHDEIRLYALDGGFIC